MLVTKAASLMAACIIRDGNKNVCVQQLMQIELDVV